VAGVEGVADPRGKSGRVPVQAVQRDRHLEHLLAVAHVGAAPRRDLAAEPACHAGARFRFQAVENGAERGVVRQPAAAVERAAGDLVAEVGVQHAPGGKAGGEERHHGAAEAQLGRHGTRVQPGGAAEGEQRVIARVHAASHRRHPHAVGHARVDQGVDARGAVHRVHAQALRQRGDGALRRRAV
jgi:hypothetical protein